MCQPDKHAISYLLTRPGGPGLVVPGYYSTECGGCDTIKTLDQAITIVVTALRAPPPGCDVLMEGLLASENVSKFAALAALHPHLHVILLTTPVEECLAAVADRRRRRGDARPLDPTNTTSRVRTIERACDRLTGVEGVTVERLGREAAFLRVCTLLRLPPGAP